MGRVAEGEQPMYRRMVSQALRLGLVVTLVVLALSACGGGGGGHKQANQQARGRPLPEYEGSLSAGQYHPTEFKPSFSFRITTDGWSLDTGPSANGDPSHPDCLFLNKDPEGIIFFFNLLKVKGVSKRGQTGETPGEIEPVPGPDELVGWFQHHPYLKTSKPEPATVGGVKGVQFDVVTANLPKDAYAVPIFALSTGGASGVIDFKRSTFIVLENVKGVPVVIQYGDEKDEFDEFVPVAEKVLESVKWTGT